MAIKFEELPKEKQLKIINAGMEVFGKNEYKRASTERIAEIAGISKGLLFYYFKNKKTLYLYIYNYCVKELGKLNLNNKFYEITDFFELLEFGSRQKLKLINEYPYMVDYIMRVFYSKNESISNDANKVFSNYTDSVYAIYFKNIDFSKFKDDVDPKKIYQRLVWMSEGYLHEKQRVQEKINIDEMIEEFNEWKKILIKIAYKEEFQ